MSLAVDSTGSVHAAWFDNRSGLRGVYYSSSADGSAWNAPIRIDTPGQNTFAVSLAVEIEPVPVQGRLYVAYQRGTDIWFTRSDDGVAWAAPQPLDQSPLSAAARSPVVAASGGRVYVAWADWRDPKEAHVLLRSSRDGGATWGPEVQISPRGFSNYEPDLAAAGDRVVVAWESAGPTPAIRSARSDDAGATWNASVVDVSPSVNENLGDASVYLDDLGTAHVAWARSGFSGLGRLYYSHSADGRAWTPSVAVDDDRLSARPRSPSISGRAGTLWIAWQDAPNGHGDIYASWSPDGLVWGDGFDDGVDLRVDDTERNADTGDDRSHQAAPVLRTDGDGVYVAWEDYRTGTADVYFSELRTSPLAFTEIQDEPATQARVEIYNSAETPYDVTGAELIAGTARVSLSPLGAVPAHGHVVIGTPASSDLQASLDLGTEGARPRIVRGTDLLASMGFGRYGIAPDPLPGESAARYAGPHDYVGTWTRAATPSFGVRNAVPKPDLAPVLKLNEVAYNMNVPADRFVELHYNGSAPLDLAGFTLVGDATYVFPSMVVSDAARFPLVFADRATALFSNLDVNSDNLYLYDASGRLLDMVGWGAAGVTDRSLARIADGVGGTTAFDDMSAAQNGWMWDLVPTPTLLELGPSTVASADVGSTVQFDVVATNRLLASDYVNVVPRLPADWTAVLRLPDGTPLRDSPGDPDVVPDLGLVGRDASVPFRADVTIPLDTAVPDEAVVFLDAGASSRTSVRANATLTIHLRPHLNVTRTVNPGTVYVEGSGPPHNEVADVTVSLRGAGLPVAVPGPQDIVFQIDDSGSMNEADPSNLRVEAVKAYIDGMRDGDRASVIGFHTTAWVVNDRPLTNATVAGKLLLETDADTLACSPNCRLEWYTDIDTALALGNDWLRTYGDRSRPWFAILLTDGECSPDPCTRTSNLVADAIAEGITIFTVGLGPNVNETVLQGIAIPTGGRYFHANTATDLFDVYDEIRTRIVRVAAVDPDVTDGVPMVQDVLASYVTPLPGTFVDPVTLLPRNPDFLARLGDRTVLQWNVSRIDIDQTWGVRYRVTSSRTGMVDVSLTPDARITSQRWDGVTVVQPIPLGRLRVLATSTPPYVVSTVPLADALDVPLDTAIQVRFSEAMNPTSVQWTIDPFVALSASWPAAAELVLTHAGLQECKRYTVQVTRGLDLQGEALAPGPVPNPWSFSTPCPRSVWIRITRLPESGNVTVDADEYPAPAVFRWVPGDVHEISVPEFDPVDGSRLAFLEWDDGGARDHVVTVGDENRTIIATFALQHPAGLTLSGLTVGRPASIRYVLFGGLRSASSATEWSSWVDDGSEVSVGGVVAGQSGERFVTGDAVRWLVHAPLQAQVAYLHQFLADVRLVGLAPVSVAVAFQSWSRAEQARASSAWSAWVDAGSSVSVEDSAAPAPRERYVTRGTTTWRAEAPLSVVVTYVHQFRPRIVLDGTDATHTVGALWTVAGVAAGVADLATEWSDWADAGTSLAFDGTTTGDPPRKTQDPTNFTVTSAFDATIRYSAASPPPPPPPPPPSILPPTNWKPLLALVYAVLLAVAGWVSGARPLRPRGRREENEDRPMDSAELEAKTARDRRRTRLLLAVPFPVVEGVIGVASWRTGVLRVPESGAWLSTGFWLDTAVLIAGIVAGLIVWWRGRRGGRTHASPETGPSQQAPLP